MRRGLRDVPGGVVGAVTASVAALFTRSGPFRTLTPIEQAEAIHVEAFGLIRHRDRPFSAAAEHVYGALKDAFFGDARE